MAKNSTVYKAHLSIADIDRNYYAEHALTLACHPSETEERLMVRLVAFALNADERLVPAAGMTDNEEPDFWLKDYTGIITLWVEIGQPDEKRILKACGRSGSVKIYTYTANPALWWNSISGKVAKAKNLQVYSIDSRSAKELAVFAQRNIDMNVTVQDDEIWVRNETSAVCVKMSLLA
ncbi:MAG: YaeQ family protein [Spirochaetota bacterium]